MWTKKSFDSLLLLVVLLLLPGCDGADNSVLTVLHTSDTHSRIEPEKSGQGGLAGRAALIESVRDSVGADNLLLLDCGDFSQGSLYYNVYKGAYEVDAMNLLGYDAAAIGNHEFDYGLENLALLLKRARFPFLCANLEFAGTPCEGLVQPYAVVEKCGKRIGLFGLSPNPEGLVLKEHCNGVVYSSPVEAAQRCADELRKKGCSLVICLSHLGFDAPWGCGDEQLAAATEGIDIILGGHSHDYFDVPVVRKNSLGKDVLINHSGKYGCAVGLLSVGSDARQNYK